MFHDKRRGDIWWMNDTHRKLPDTRLIRGDHPVVVVSSNTVNQNTNVVNVIPLTASQSQMARGDGYCDNVTLLGYGEPSTALTRQVCSIDLDDLQYYVGHLTETDMTRIDTALRRVLGL